MDPERAELFNGSNELVDTGSSTNGGKSIHVKPETDKKGSSLKKLCTDTLLPGWIESRTRKESSIHAKP